MIDELIDIEKMSRALDMIEREPKKAAKTIKEMIAAKKQQVKDFENVVR